MSVDIPVVLGTGRVDRKSEQVARFVHERLLAYEAVRSTFVDVREFLVSPFTIAAWEEDRNASKWRKIASEAAGFIFVVPEYNRGFPGEFKLLFDSAFKEYKGKPAVLVGVSDGQYGGVRVIQQLAPVLLAAHIETLGTVVATAWVDELFQGGIPVNETYRKFVDGALENIITRVSK